LHFCIGCCCLLVCCCFYWVCFISFVNTRVVHAGVVDSPSCLVQSSLYNNNLPSFPHVADELDDVGERVLRETRYDREQKVRLRQIEDDLARLTSSELDEVPRLLLLRLYRYCYHRRRLVRMTVGARFLPSPSRSPPPSVFPPLPSLLTTHPFPPSSVPLPQLFHPILSFPFPLPLSLPTPLKSSKEVYERAL